MKWSRVMADLLSGALPHPLVSLHVHYVINGCDAIYHVTGLVSSLSNWRYRGLGQWLRLLTPDSHPTLPAPTPYRPHPTFPVINCFCHSVCTTGLDFFPLSENCLKNHLFFANQKRSFLITRLFFRISVQLNYPENSNINFTSSYKTKSTC